MNIFVNMESKVSALPSNKRQKCLLEGIFTAADLHADLRALFDNGFGPGADTGWEEMDNICTYERRRLLIVTAVPGDGNPNGLMSWYCVSVCVINGRLLSSVRKITLLFIISEN